MADEQADKPSGQYELRDVATEYGRAIYDPQGENVSEQAVLVQIANDVALLKDKLVGK